MKYSLLHCCEKTMNDRMTLYREKSDNSNMTKVLFGIGLGMLFSELCKIMVNKLTFLYFRVGHRPPWIRPCLGALVLKMRFLAAMLLLHTCFCQARNQLGKPRRTKCFLGGAKNFWTMSNSFKFCPTHFSRKGEKSPRGLLTLRP